MASPISIQFWTLRTILNAESAPEIMQELAKIGLNGVEGVAPGFSNSDFRKYMADLGMVISSSFGPTPEPNNLQKIVDDLGELGTNLLTGGFWIPDLETADAVKASAEKLAWAIPELKKHGIEYAMHNHWMEFETRDGIRVIDLMIEHCPDLRLELDIYWASNFGEHNSADICRQYADRITLLHVKDGPLVKDRPMVPLGQGKVPVRDCIEACQPKWLVIELDEYEGDMMHAVRESYQFLMKEKLGLGRVAVDENP